MILALCVWLYVLRHMKCTWSKAYSRKTVPYTLFKRVIIFYITRPENSSSTSVGWMHGYGTHPMLSISNSHSPTLTIIRKRIIHYWWSKDVYKVNLVTALIKNNKTNKTIMTGGFTSTSCSIYKYNNFMAIPSLKSLSFASQ